MADEIKITIIATGFLSTNGTDEKKEDTISPVISLFEEKKQAELASQAVEVNTQVIEPIIIQEEKQEVVEIVEEVQVQDEKKELPAFMKRLFGKK